MTELTNEFSIHSNSLFMDYLNIIFLVCVRKRCVSKKTVYKYQWHAYNSWIATMP